MYGVKDSNSAAQVSTRLKTGALQTDGGWRGFPDLRQVFIAGAVAFGFPE
jgi:hypothetical protein